MSLSFSSIFLGFYFVIWVFNLELFIYVLEIFYSIFGFSHFILEWDLLLFALTWVRLGNYHLFGAKLKKFLMVSLTDMLRDREALIH